MSLLAGLAVGSLAAGALSNVIGGINASNQARDNLSLQQKNLDWQKHVQQETWNREDTAIQRRKADLEAAGFNPYIAATGNGANAGSIVSTQAPQNNFNPQPYIQGFNQSIQAMPGAAVDMLKALEQYKQDKLYTNYMQLKNYEQEAYNTDFNYYLMHNYGYLGEDGNFHLNYFPDYINMSADTFSRYKNSSLAWMNRASDYVDAKLNYKSVDTRWDMLQNDFAMQEYNKDLLKVKRDFAVSDKIEQYILDSIGALTGASNSARGWYDSYNKKITPPRMQNYRESYTRNRNGYTRTRDYFN